MTGARHWRYGGTILTISEYEYPLESHMIERLCKVVKPEDLQTHEEYVTIPYRYFREHLQVYDGTSVPVALEEISEEHFYALMSAHKEDEEQ